MGGRQVFGFRVRGGIHHTTNSYQINSIPLTTYFIWFVSDTFHTFYRCHSLFSPMLCVLVPAAEHTNSLYMVLLSFTKPSCLHNAQRNTMLFGCVVHPLQSNANPVAQLFQLTQYSWAACPRFRFKSFSHCRRKDSHNFLIFTHIVCQLPRVTKTPLRIQPYFSLVQTTNSFVGTNTKPVYRFYSYILVPCFFTPRSRHVFT